jgi:hypothetical protein
MYQVACFKKLAQEVSDDYDCDGDRGGHSGFGNNRKGEMDTTYVIK